MLTSALPAHLPRPEPVELRVRQTYWVMLTSFSEPECLQAAGRRAASPRVCAHRVSSPACAELDAVRLRVRSELEAVRPRV